MHTNAHTNAPHIAASTLHKKRYASRTRLLTAEFTVYSNDSLSGSTLSTIVVATTVFEMFTLTMLANSELDVFVA